MFLNLIDMKLPEPSFLLKILGGLILLASWVAREMWGRKQEQLISAYRRALDGKARAEDAYLACLTQRRIWDSIVYMQVGIGFMDEIMDKPASPQKVSYLQRAQKIQGELDNSRKSYALDRLKHLGAAVNGREASEYESAQWDKMSEEEVKREADKLAPEAEKVGKRLQRNTRWADRIVATMYVIGTLLVLTSG